MHIRLSFALKINISPKEYYRKLFATFDCVIARKTQSNAIRDIFGTSTAQNWIYHPTITNNPGNTLVIIPAV